MILSTFLCLHFYVNILFSLQFDKAVSGKRRRRQEVEDEVFKEIETIGTWPDGEEKESAYKEVNKKYEILQQSSYDWVRAKKYIITPYNP